MTAFLPIAHPPAAQAQWKSILSKNRDSRIKDGLGKKAKTGICKIALTAASSSGKSTRRVGQPGGGHLGYSPLGRGERLKPGEDGAPRPRACR